MSIDGYGRRWYRRVRERLDRGGRGGGGEEVGHGARQRLDTSTFVSNPISPIRCYLTFFSAELSFFPSSTNCVTSISSVTYTVIIMGYQFRVNEIGQKSYSLDSMLGIENKRITSQLQLETTVETDELSIERSDKVNKLKDKTKWSDRLSIPQQDDADS